MLMQLHISLNIYKKYDNILQNKNEWKPKCKGLGHCWKGFWWITLMSHVWTENLTVAQGCSFQWMYWASFLPLDTKASCQPTPKPRLPYRRVQKLSVSSHLNSIFHCCLRCHLIFQFRERALNHKSQSTFYRLEYTMLFFYHFY